MEFNAGQINTFGPNAQYFSSFSSDTTALLGSAEIGQIKDFVPRYTYKVYWCLHMNAGASVFVPGSGTGASTYLPGVRMYGDLYKGATNGNIVEWQPMTISETKAKGEFILPQGSEAFAVSFINMNGIDNTDIYLNMFAHRLSPIRADARGEVWE